MINAIIVAGGQTIKGLEEAGNKALYSINGRAMIEYVIDAVRMADDVQKVIVVGPKNSLDKHLKGKIDALIDSDGSVMENVMAGISYLGDDNYILICTCDIPLITVEAVNDFITKAKVLGADLCYPIVEKELNDKKYSGMERTYVKIKEGQFTGGNIFYVNPKTVKENYSFAEKLIVYRKKPIKMARLLSFNFMIKFLMGKVTIDMVEKKFSEITGISGRAVISLYPEIGQDVDKSCDVYAATGYLNSRE
ncbi:MAG TPA: nucleotidyltransferase family protein [Clostridiales bacterium]|nr:nucleotidyltransferase family protein [Clostridiales bacterium]